MVQSLKVIILGLIVAFGISYAFAWTAPASDPPLGNVSAPVNISSVTQYKAGALGIGGIFQTDTDTYLASLSGNVGIGTVSPAEKLDVAGNIKASGTVCDGTGACIGSGGTRTVSGVVDSSGSILLGTGFTVSRTGSYYDITFTTPFASKPVVVAAQDSSGGAAYIEQDPNSSSSKVQIWTLDNNGNSVARDFSFIAVVAGSSGGGGGNSKAWITMTDCGPAAPTTCPLGWTQYGREPSGTCDENGGDRRWTRYVTSCYKDF